MHRSCLGHRPCTTWCRHHYHDFRLCVIEHGTGISQINHITHDDIMEVRYPPFTMNVSDNLLVGMCIDEYAAFTFTFTSTIKVMELKAFGGITWWSMVLVYSQRSLWGNRMATIEQFPVRYICEKAAEISMEKKHLCKFIYSTPICGDSFPVQCLYWISYLVRGNHIPDIYTK